MTMKTTPSLRIYHPKPNLDGTALGLSLELPTATESGHLVIAIASQTNTRAFTWDTCPNFRCGVGDIAKLLSVLGGETDSVTIDHGLVGLELNRLANGGYTLKLDGGKWCRAIRIERSEMRMLAFAIERSISLISFGM